MPMAADEEAAVVPSGDNSGGFPLLPSVNIPAGGMKVYRVRLDSRQACIKYLSA